MSVRVIVCCDGCGSEAECTTRPKGLDVGMSGWRGPLGWALEEGLHFCANCDPADFTGPPERVVSVEQPS